jgi:hypothetical protein
MSRVSALIFGMQVGIDGAIKEKFLGFSKIV